MEGNTTKRRVGAVVAAVLAAIFGFAAYWYAETTKVERSLGLSEWGLGPAVVLMVLAAGAAAMAIALAQPVRPQ
jgi:hypothetical protein